MDAGQMWTVIGSIAGVVGVAVAVLIGVLQLRRTPKKGDGKPPAGGGGVLPPPEGRLPPEVRGRDGLVRELAKLAAAPDGRVHVLAGLGGSGKSTVALAVAQQATLQPARRLTVRHRKRQTQIWWVPATDPVSMTGELLGLAEKLGAAKGEVQETLAGRLNPSDVLWPQLEAARGWVLVFDNADDVAGLAVGGRAAGDAAGWLRPSRAGLVLVTSRTSAGQAWGPAAVVHPVGSLDAEDGGKVLADLAPGAGDAAQAASLSARLGGLPLALHQAGSYLGSPFATERTFTAYTAALADRFAELLGRGGDDRTRVTATWELSLTALAAQGRGQARVLLRVLSCFAAAVPIPQLILDAEVLGAWCGGAAAVEEGLSGLLAVGLIDTLGPNPVVRVTKLRSGATIEVRDSARLIEWSRSVLVHPLVAETIRRQDAAELGEAAVVAAALLTAVTSHLEQGLRDWAGWLAVLPHLRAVLNLSSALPAAALAALAGTVAGETRALLSYGDYPAALDVAEAALMCTASLGHEHAQVLELRSRRASARLELGQTAAAETELRQVLEAQLRVLGPNDPSALATWYEIGVTLIEQGKYVAAETELRQVLEAQLRVLGPNDSSALLTRSKIARMPFQQGDPADAEAEHQQVLDAEPRVPSRDHPQQPDHPA